MFNEQLLKQILDMAATEDVYWNLILSSLSYSQAQIAAILIVDKDPEERAFPCTFRGSMN